MPINVEKLYDNGYSLEEILDQVTRYVSEKDAEKNAVNEELARIEEEYIRASIAYYRSIGILDEDMSDEEATELIKKANAATNKILKSPVMPSFFPRIFNN